MTGFGRKAGGAAVMALLLLAASGAQGSFAQGVKSPFAPPAGGANDAGSALPSTGQDDAALPGMSLSTQEQFAGGGGAVPSSPTTQKSSKDIEKEIRSQAFNAALTGLLPMKPDEIRRTLERYDDTKQAIEVPVYPYPKPEVSVQTVSLDPGVTPPVLRVAKGYVSTLMFVDVTGAPWPVKDMTWAGNFDIIEGNEGSPILRISPTTDFAYGNLSVRLVGLDTPVLFTIKTTRDKVDYRFDARVAQYGPNAQVPLISGGISISAGGSVINSMLDGVPPSEATTLKVSGVDGRTTAYRFDDTTYLRTPLTLLSPAWTQSVSSGDGMNVYALSSAPVVLLSDHGQVVRARLSEEDNSDE